MNVDYKILNVVCCNDCDDGDACNNKLKCKYFDASMESCPHFKDTGNCLRLNDGIFCKQVVWYFADSDPAYSKVFTPDEVQK